MHKILSVLYKAGIVLYQRTYAGNSWYITPSIDLEINHSPEKHDHNLDISLKRIDRGSHSGHRMIA